MAARLRIVGRRRGGLSGICRRKGLMLPRRCSRVLLVGHCRGRLDIRALGSRVLGFGFGFGGG